MSAEVCPVCLTFCQGRHDGPPIEAVDFPRPGERVIYTPGDGSPRHIAVVHKVAAHDGDVDLSDVHGECMAQDVKPGYGPHTYERIDT